LDGGSRQHIGDCWQRKGERATKGLGALQDIFHGFLIHNASGPIVGTVKRVQLEFGSSRVGNPAAIIWKANKVREWMGRNVIGIRFGETKVAG
jgi:hypothetical protein